MAIMGIYSGIMLVVGSMTYVTGLVGKLGTGEGNF
jgi:hypothetical protein